MSDQSSKDQPGKAGPDTAAPNSESPEMLAALAQFNSILEKATLSPAKAGESSAEKPGQ